jgi:hypothetical protein
MSKNLITYDDLFQKGVLVDFDARKWHPIVRINPKDIGVERTPEIDKALTMGGKRLFPHQPLRRINRVVCQARELIDELSMQFPLVAGSRFVPSDRLDELRERFAVLEEKHREYVDELIANFDDVKALHLPVIVKALRDMAKNPDAVDTAVAKLEGLYPAKEIIRQKFAMSIRTFAITAPRDENSTKASREQADTVKGILRDMIGGMREEMVERTEAIKDLVVRGGKLGEKTYQCALDLCDRLDSINVMQDATISRTTTILRKAVDAARSDKDGAPAALKSGVESIEQALTKSVDGAVQAATRRLTGVGRRRIG